MSLSTIVLQHHKGDWDLDAPDQILAIMMSVMNIDGLSGISYEEFLTVMTAEHEDDLKREHAG